MQQITQVTLLRSTSLGVVGSIKNANHHAQPIIPFINALAPHLHALGFKTWRQGNNIHELVTTEGTRYTLRAFKGMGEYVGVRLSLRVSRSYEIRLIDITDVDECDDLLDIMRQLAKPAQGELGALIANC